MFSSCATSSLALPYPLLHYDGRRKIASVCSTTDTQHWGGDVQRSTIAFRLDQHRIHERAEISGVPDGSHILQKLLHEHMSAN
jgi:hypothetical protein